MLALVWVMLAGEAHTSIEYSPVVCTRLAIFWLLVVSACARLPWPKMTPHA